MKNRLTRMGKISTKIKDQCMLYFSPLKVTVKNEMMKGKYLAFSKDKKQQLREVVAFYKPF